VKNLGKNPWSEQSTKAAEVKKDASHDTHSIKAIKIVISLACG